MPRLLDCTLRDGGFYTNWFFDSQFVDQYFEIINQLQIYDVEVGYSNPFSGEYHGEYFFTHPKTLLHAKKALDPKVRIWLMLDLKRCDDLSEIYCRLNRHGDNFYGVRITVPFENHEFLPELVKTIRSLRKEVALNLMYSHNYLNQSDKLDTFISYSDELNSLSIVDSYGVLKPQQVSELMHSACHKFQGIDIGFHGHNNLELVAANSIAAIEAGANIVDCTMAGFGRGAGNLRTELAHLLFVTENVEPSHQTNIALCNIDQLFQSLRSQHEWGAKTPLQLQLSTVCRNHW